MQLQTLRKEQVCNLEQRYLDLLWWMISRSINTQEVRMGKSRRSRLCLKNSWLIKRTKSQCILILTIKSNQSTLSKKNFQTEHLICLWQMKMEDFLRRSSLLSIRLMVELLTKLMLQISFLSLKTSSLSIM